MNISYSWVKRNRFKDDSSNFDIDHWCEIGNVFETGAKDGEEKDSIGRKQFAGGSDRHPLFDHPLWGSHDPRNCPKFLFPLHTMCIIMRKINSSRFKVFLYIGRLFY